MDKCLEVQLQATPKLAVLEWCWTIAIELDDQNSFCLNFDLETVTPVKFCG